MSLLNTYGWSTVTFDGKTDSPVVPRTSSKSFHFEESDKRMVQELRQWAANQSWISSDLTVTLSSVQPGMYFDLTCQLLAKAVMDSRCILLKVLSVFFIFLFESESLKSLNLESSTDGYTMCSGLGWDKVSTSPIECCGCI